MAKPSDAGIPKETLVGLKALEANIRLARETIRRLTRENDSLKKRLEALDHEKRELANRTKELQGNAKISMMARGRSMLAKAKIQEMIRRIEQVETEGESARNKD